LRGDRSARDRPRGRRGALDRRLRALGRRSARDGGDRGRHASAAGRARQSGFREVRIVSGRITGRTPIHAARAVSRPIRAGDPALGGPRRGGALAKGAGARYDALAAPGPRVRQGRRGSRRRRHMNRIDAVQPVPPRRDLPPFRPGDTVRVHVSITEGDKQRIQVFEGVVIRRRGRGASATFTVRKISYGVGVERIFLTEAPSVTKVEIKARGHVRRARLYYLRDLRGKKARLRSKLRDLTGLIGEEGAGTAAEADAAEALPAAPEGEPEAANAGENAADTAT